MLDLIFMINGLKLHVIYFVIAGAITVSYHLYCQLVRPVDRSCYGPIAINNSSSACSCQSNR